MFMDSQGVKQDIMLRTQAKAFTDLHHVSSQIKSINAGGSCTWWIKTCSNTEVWSETKLLKKFAYLGCCIHKNKSHRNCCTYAVHYVLHMYNNLCHLGAYFCVTVHYWLHFLPERFQIITVRCSSTLTSKHEQCGCFASSVVSQKCCDVSFINVDAQLVHSRSLFLAEFLQKLTHPHH